MTGAHGRYKNAISLAEVYPSGPACDKRVPVDVDLSQGGWPAALAAAGFDAAQQSFVRRLGSGEVFGGANTSGRSEACIILWDGLVDGSLIG